VREDDVLVNVTPQTFKENGPLIKELLQEAVKEDEG
jgi:hypothetical protein